MTRAGAGALVSAEDDGASVDASELHFLVLHHLRGLPCPDAAAAFEREALALGLLPRRHDVFGGTHDVRYDELRAERYARVRPDHLLRLVQRVATHTSDGARLAACGVSTLLGDGACSILGADAPSSSGARRPPARLSRPHLRPWWNASRSRELFGSPRDSRRCRERTALLPSALLGASLEPRATFRGHRAALYCIIFDKTGRRVVTGSDDHLVKIWSTETGDLMHACRGHRGEIAYLDVNASNELVASASFDFTIRTWFLASGEPCATLVGHGDIVSEARFSPVAPNALLSASWDGTLRLWNAREDSSVAPPVVLDAFSPSGAGAPRRETREENAAAYRSASAAFVASASVAAAAEARGALPDDRDAPRGQCSRARGAPAETSSRAAPRTARCARGRSREEKKQRNGPGWREAFLPPRASRAGT